MKFLQLYGGLFSVAVIVGVFALIGWVCDEWEKRKKPKP